MTRTIEPLRFERRFLEKVWGGRSLERRPGIELPADVPVGETWEIVDRETENSVVAEGEFRGRSLGELMQRHGDDILGSAPRSKEGRFPLLVKYIDAAQDLSVQVHPDDETALQVGHGAEGKTEAWYIIDVAPGGVLYAGLRPDVRAEEFAAIADGPGVVDALLRWEVEPGDCVLVTGGTVHAIGAGVTIIEVQQNSDTTYRLWDWGRVGLDGKPRETHVDLALPCIRFGQPARPPMKARWQPRGEGARAAPLARSDYFGLDALKVTAPARLETGGQFQIYAVIEGRGSLAADGGFGPRPMNPGDVWLVPAACGYHSIRPETDELALVQMFHQP